MRSAIEVLERERYKVYEDNKSWVFYPYRKFYDDKSKVLVKRVLKKFGKRNLNPVITIRKDQYDTFILAEAHFIQMLQAGIDAKTILLGRKCSTFTITFVNGFFHFELTEEFRKELVARYGHKTEAQKSSSVQGMSSDDIFCVMKAFKEGKAIEKRFINDDNWKDDPNPIWAFDRIVYRVKSIQRLTNRELAEWLAKGNGQKRNKVLDDTPVTQHTYPLERDDMEVLESIVVRPWGSDRWITPSRDLIDRGNR